MGRKKLVKVLRLPRTYPPKAASSAPGAPEQASSAAKGAKRTKLIAGEAPPAANDGAKAEDQAETNAENQAETNAENQAETNAEDKPGGEAEDKGKEVVGAKIEEEEEEEEYIDYSMKKMFEVEIEHPIRVNHLDNQEHVSYISRAIALNLLYDLFKQYGMHKDVYHIAVGIIDRYLQAVTLTSKAELKLLSLTAMQMVDKLRSKNFKDTWDIDMPMHFAVHEVKEMELKIENVIRCDIPYAKPFLNRICNEAKIEVIHKAAAIYYIELCTLEITMASCKPSQMAAAAIYCSFLEHGVNIKCPIPFIDVENYWDTNIKRIARYSSDQLKQTVKNIQKLVELAPRNDLKSIYSRFMSLMNLLKQFVAAPKPPPESYVEATNLCAKYI